MVVEGGTAVACGIVVAGGGVAGIANGGGVVVGMVAGGGLSSERGSMGTARGIGGVFSASCGGGGGGFCANVGRTGIGVATGTSGMVPVAGAFVPS